MVSRERLATAPRAIGLLRRRTVLRRAGRPLQSPLPAAQRHDIVPDAAVVVRWCPSALGEGEAPAEPNRAIKRECGSAGASPSQNLRGWQPMNLKNIELRYDYGYWANRKIFAVLPQLTPEQFAEPFADGHGSIRSTLVHILSAEWGWIGRCSGKDRGPALDPANYPTPAALI